MCAPHTHMCAPHTHMCAHISFTLPLNQPVIQTRSRIAAQAGAKAITRRGFPQLSGDRAGTVKLLQYSVLDEYKALGRGAFIVEGTAKWANLGLLGDRYGGGGDILTGAIAPRRSPF